MVLTSTRAGRQAVSHFTGNCNQELNSDNYHTLQVLNFEKVAILI